MPVCLPVCVCLRVVKIIIVIAIAMDPGHDSSTLHADAAAAADKEEDSLRFSSAIAGIRVPVQ